MTRPLLVLTILIAQATPTVADAQEATGDDAKLSAAVKFLREHVAGKTFRAEGKFLSDGGKLDRDYSIFKEYGPVTTTERGFYFDVVATYKATLFEVKDGRRDGPGKKYDKTIVHHYEFHKSDISDSITGFMRNTLNTQFDPTGYAEGVRLESGADRVTLKSSPLFFDEGPVAGGKRALKTSNTVEEFAVREGRIRVRVESNSFDVNPETLEKKLGADPPRVYENAEVDGKI